MQPIGELDLYIPKFLKDPLEINDISGTKSWKKIKDYQLTQTNYIDDIEYARPAKEKPIKLVKDILNTSDINKKKTLYNSIGWNPLDP